METLKNNLQKKKPDLIITDFFQFGVIQYCQDNHISLSVMGIGVLGVLNFHDKHYFPGFFKFPEYLKDAQTFARRFDKTVIFLVKNLPSLIRATGIVESARERNGISKTGDLWSNYKKNLVLVPDIVFSYPRPLPANVRPVGWIIPSFNETHNFDEKLQKFLDSNDNIFYVSYGSQFVPPLNHFEAFVHLMKKKVEMKEISLVFSLNSNQHFELASEILKGYSNVYLSRWLNQRVLLEHKNVKIFFSHGGLSSIAEAVWSETPLIITPIGAEQNYNAVRVQELGIGDY